MSSIIRTQIVKIKFESLGYSSSGDQTQEVIEDLRRIASELEEWQKKEYKLESYPFQKPIVFTMARNIQGSLPAPPFEETSTIDPAELAAAKSIEELGVSVRLYNVLKNANFLTIGEVVRYSEQELLDRKIKNFSRKTLNELKEVLGSFGLKLRE